MAKIKGISMDLFHEKTIKRAMKILLKLHRSWPMKSQKFVSSHIIFNEIFMGLTKAMKWGISIFTTIKNGFMGF